MSELSMSKPRENETTRKWARATAAGVAGMISGGAISFILLFGLGPATIFNESLQSPKLLAVWGELEPLPLMNSHPAAFGLLLAVLGAVHGLVFAIIATGLPEDTIRRGLLYGLIIWLMSTLFFELQGPLALLAEPLPLVAIELAIGLAGALVEGLVISWIYGKA